MSELRDRLEALATRGTRRGADDVLSAAQRNAQTIAADDNATTTYPIAALTHSTEQSIAQAFVAYVLSSAGQQVLTAAGFEKP